MPSNLTKVTAFALFAVVAGTASAQQPAAPASAWKTHTFAEDRFEIEFSGPFTTSAVKLDTQTRKKVVRSTQYMLADGDRLFVVAAQNNVEAVNFDGGSRSSFATLNCKQIQPETEVPLEGGRGREIKGTECIDGEMRAEARYFEHGKWFYQVIAIFTAKDEDQAAARRFLASFKLIQK